MVATLWLGGLQVEAGKIEAGVILAFINYLTIILNGLMSTAWCLCKLHAFLQLNESILCFKNKR